MNLPNSLTVTRIFLVPVLLVVLLTGDFPNREVWGLVVFLAAAMTDFLDGYLARRRAQVTTVGKLLDPIADKLLITSALVALVEMGVAPAWMVVIIIGREFAVTGLRSLAVTKGLTIDASRLGKYKMVSQVACCSFLIAGSRFPESSLSFVGILLLWLVVLLALTSMLEYFHRFWSRVEEPEQNERHVEVEEHPKPHVRREDSSDVLLKP